MTVASIPAYNILSPYRKGEQVVFNGAVYQAAQDVPPQTDPTNGAFWTLVPPNPTGIMPSPVGATDGYVPTVEDGAYVLAPVGGGSALCLISGNIGLEASGLSDLSSLAASGSFLPSGTTFGDVGASTSAPPSTYAPGATILNFAEAQAQLSTASTVDDYGLQVFIIVSNALSTEVIELSGTATIDEGDVGPSILSGAELTATAVAGTDLSYDPSTGVLTTTAGGVYAVAASLSGGWE